MPLEERVWKVKFFDMKNLGKKFEFLLQQIATWILQSGKARRPAAAGGPAAAGPAAARLRGLFAKPESKLQLKVFAIRNKSKRKVLGKYLQFKINQKEKF